MILTPRILEKIVNSDYIKQVYPMIDRVETKMDWDGDEEIPFYDIELDIYVNDSEMTLETMYERGMDPHYLIDHHLIFLLKMAGFLNPSSVINQIEVRVIGPDGKVIYGSEEFRKKTVD